MRDAGAQHRHDRERPAHHVGQHDQLQLDRVLVAVGQLVVEELGVAQLSGQRLDHRSVGADRAEGRVLVEPRQREEVGRGGVGRAEDHEQVRVAGRQGAVGVGVPGRATRVVDVRGDDQAHRLAGGRRRAPGRRGGPARRPARSGARRDRSGRRCPRRKAPGPAGPGTRAAHGDAAISRVGPSRKPASASASTRAESSAVPSSAPADVRERQQLRRRAGPVQLLRQPVRGRGEAQPLSGDAGRVAQHHQALAVVAGDGVALDRDEPGSVAAVHATSLPFRGRSRSRGQHQELGLFCARPSPCFAGAPTRLALVAPPRLLARLPLPPCASCCGRRGPSRSRVEMGSGA